MPSSPPIPVPELLAPAGSPEAFTAAIAAGADAVYLGGGRFSARQNAPNFPGRELADAMRFAHVHGVRVYVTVNTLLRDAEIPEAADFLGEIYSLGADAVLLQDAGLSVLARDIVPGLPRHASTQVGIYSREGVAWARREGFARVVLARETTLEDVRAIASAPECRGIGLEIFAHGALCYSYSGQCLLSSVIGGRSGNRGECAQPCRKPYRLVYGPADRYGRPGRLREVSLPGRVLLSPRDLCTYPELARVVSSGVAALKIEGRMRSPEYVFKVTSVYRRALDAVAAGNFSPSVREHADLALAFSRDFTRGYLCGDGPSRVMGRDQSGNRGLRIGTVRSWQRERGEALVDVSSRVLPESGDGIAFRDRGGALVWGGRLRYCRQEGVRLIRVAVPSQVPSGSALFLTSRAGSERKTGSEIRRALALLPPRYQVDLTARIEPGVPPSLSAVLSGEGLSSVPVMVQGDEQVVSARTRPVTPEEVCRVLSRTGVTPFAVHSCTSLIIRPAFVSPAMLTTLRRTLLDRASGIVASAAEPSRENVTAMQERLHRFHLGRPFPDRDELSWHVPALWVIAGESLSVSAAAAAGADMTWIEPLPEAGSGGPLAPAVVQMEVTASAAACREHGSSCGWKWPHVPGSRFMKEAMEVLPGLPARDVAAVLVESIVHADLVTTKGCSGVMTVVSPSVPVWNRESLARVAPLCRAVILSPELTLPDIERLSAARLPLATPPALVVPVQGNLEAMISRDNLLSHLPTGGETTGLSGIIDERNRIFPVRADGEGLTVIRNAVETCLLDHLPALSLASIDAVLIDARGRGPVYTREMTGLYRRALGLLSEEGMWADARVTPVKEEIRRIALGGITAGALSPSVRRGQD